MTLEVEADTDINSEVVFFLSEVAFNELIWSIFVLIFITKDLIIILF